MGKCLCCKENTEKLGQTMRSPLMAPLVLTFLLTPLNGSNSRTDNKDIKLKITDEKVLRSLEKNLMSLFGFSKRPRPKKDIVIPSAMLQLYKEQTGFDVDTTNFNLPGKLTLSANTVRSFTHAESSIDRHFLKGNRFRLYFKIDNLPKFESLKAAELQLSRVASEQQSSQILVHDIVLPGIKGKREPIIRLIDSKEIFFDQSEIVKLDVMPAVERWVRDSRTNHGLLVTMAASKSKNRQHLVDHVRLKRGISEEAKEWKKVEPQLLLFTDDGKSNKESGSSLRRSSRGVKKSRRKDGRNSCRRRELYVDFSEVGWNDWIVAPPGYEAFYCAGDCPFPMSDHFNATNHAIVQTLVHSMYPNSLPRACCVPTALEPISMLYVDEENKVVLKNYQDMSVLQCGCR